jgi:hypothetical protein
MREAAANQIQAPSYLEQIEHTVQVRFPLDVPIHEAARAQPESLEPDLPPVYAEIYVGGLRLLAAARREFGALPNQLTQEQRQQLRASHAEEISDVRQKLVAAAPVTSTPPGALSNSQLAQEKQVNQVEVDAIIAEMEPVQIIAKATEKSSVANALHFTAEDASKARTKAAAIYAVRTRARNIKTRAKKAALALTAEPEIIVPSEYLTVGEYAALRGMNESKVRRTVIKHNFPQHAFPLGPKKQITYIDGATMHALDGLIERTDPPEVAPEGWPTMKELIAEFDISQSSIDRHLDNGFRGTARDMLPRRGGTRALPHYPPEFRAHLGAVVKQRVTEVVGRTSLSVLAERAGVSKRSMQAALANRGLTPTAEVVKNSAANGHEESFYNDEELAAIMPTMPQHRIPGRGIGLSYLAKVNGVTEGTMSGRLSKAGITRAGRYYLDFDENPRQLGSFYSKDELRAAGFRLPAEPAFPAGERPYLKYGPPKGHIYERQPSQAYEPLTKILYALPDDTRPSRDAAVQFVTAHGGQVHRVGSGVYLLGMSAGLLNYNFGRPGSIPQTPGTGWLNRDQLAELTGQPVDVIDNDLHRLDWAAVRKELVGVRIIGSGETAPRDRSRVHILWYPPEGSTTVLPHYNPTIVSSIVKVAGERQAHSLTGNLENSLAA